MNKIIKGLLTDPGVRIGGSIGIVVFSIAVYAALNTSSVKKEEPKPTVQEVSALTEDIMLDSMVRAWTDDAHRFLKVCYDGPREKEMHGFFVQYGPKASAEDKTLAEGWWYVEQQFYRTSAGKIYTNDIPALADNAHVYPDITGLTCKDR